jgi:hypothetical protein
MYIFSSLDAAVSVLRAHARKSMGSRQSWNGDSGKANSGDHATVSQIALIYPSQERSYAL